MKKISLVLVLFVVFTLSACQPAGTAVDPAPVSPSPTAAAATFTATPAPSPTPTAEPSTPTPEPTATLLPDRRLAPETRRDWPVIPQVSNFARQVYADGLAAGNDAHAFSVIGGPEWIMPDENTLNSAEGQAADTASYYFDALQRRGVAQIGALPLEAVLSPEYGGVEPCAPAESLLACELNSYRPAIVLIHLQEAGKNGDPALAESIYRQVIDSVLASKAVPVLALNAESSAGDANVNDMLARLAYEYDIPAWNLAAAVRQNLDVRQSLLEMLASIHGGLRDLQPEWRVAPAASAGAAAQYVVFGVREKVGGEYVDMGVYRFDSASQMLEQIVDEGYNLQAVSADGSQLLINKGSQLYVTDASGQNQKLVLDSLKPEGGQSAAWAGGNAGLVVIAGHEGVDGLWLVSMDGGSWQQLSFAGAQPVEIYPPMPGGKILWAAGVCSGLQACDLGGVWETDLNGFRSEELGVGINRPRLSPDGKFWSYRYTNEDGRFELAVEPISRAHTWKLTMPGDPIPNFSKPRPHVMDMGWSPDGKRLAVLFLERSYYNGTLAFNRLYVLNPYNEQTFEPGMLLWGQNARVIWSPDGQVMWMSGTHFLKDVDGKYRIQIHLLDVNTYNEIELPGSLDMVSENYIFTTNVYWVPK